MELRHLQTFVAVADVRSFSRAADRLRVVQSAVSATIRNLEREWDVALFHRTTHRVELTAEGRALLPEARAALRAAEAVAHAVDEVHGGLRGTLRLGIMQASAVHGGRSAAAVLAAFRAEHPDVTVQLRQGGSVTQAAAVRAGEIDLAFVGIPDRDLVGLRITPMAAEEMVLACPQGHPLAGRDGVALGELAGETFVDVPGTWGVRVVNDRAFEAAGATRRIVYEINDLATVVDFVRNGLAVAITARATATDPRIALVPIRGEAPRFMIRLVSPASGPGGAVARAFVAVAERVAREAG